MSGPPLLYITGTNTGVGKTTLALQLLRCARERDLRVGALKPFCSGGREDAEQLHALQNADLTLDEVNPFYFREAITPFLAARHEGRRIELSQALSAIEVAQRGGCPLLIEGAGGLLSPFGDQFSLADLIKKAPGKVCIVGANVLGVLNSVLLTAHRLPVPCADQTVVLMAPLETDASTSTNASLLSSLIGGEIYEYPRLDMDKAGNQIANRLLDWWLE